MAISFIRGKKVGAPPKYAGSKKGDPLTAAKTKVIDALKVQKGYAQLTIEGKQTRIRTPAERGAPGSTGRSTAPTGRRCATASSPSRWRARCAQQVPNSLSALRTRAPRGMTWMALTCSRWSERSPALATSPRWCLAPIISSA